MRRVLRHPQARAGLPHDLPDTRCSKARCVRIHRAVPQPEDAATGCQAGSEVLRPFTTVRGFWVEPKFSAEFKRGAVEQASQPGVSGAQVARELGIRELAPSG